MKKLLSMLLTVAMMLSLACPAFAEGVAAISVNNAVADPGEQITIPLSIENNPGVAFLKIRVAYDANLTLDKVENGDVFADSAFTGPQNTTKNPAPIVWNVGTSNIDKNGVLANLTFTLSEDAEIGSNLNITVTVVEAYDTAEKNVEIKNATAAVIAGSVHYAITASATEGGSIDPSGTVKVKEGESQAFTFKPSEGYHLKNVTVDDESVGRESSYTFSDVQSTHTIMAVFEGHTWNGGEITKEATCTETGVKTYTCTVCGETKTEGIAAKGHTEENIPGKEATCTETGLTNGTKCSVCGEVLVPQNVIPTKEHTPDGNTNCAKETKCAVCGAVLKAAGEHAWNEGVVTKEATCTEDGVKTYTCTGESCGETKTETIPAAHKWNNGEVTKDPTCTETGVKTYTCTACGETRTEKLAMVAHNYGSGGKCTVCGAAKPAGGGGGGGGGAAQATFKLSFVTNGGSTISAVFKTSGSVIDLSGYVTTKNGYTFAGWYSDKALTTRVTSVKLSENMTVYAKWTENSAAPENPFADVAEDSYCHDAVLWAVEKSITNGVTDTAFQPGASCTRAQMVTFLWRNAGSPEPVSTENPFTDVSASAYYYKAVLWAVEQGITNGTTATTFAPNATVTRGQTVTFLYRYAGSPAVTGSMAFTDVRPESFCGDAVIWATEKGITNGITATTFGPNDSCTRGQIVTFLYRDSI